MSFQAPLPAILSCVLAAPLLLLCAVWVGEGAAAPVVVSLAALAALNRFGRRRVRHDWFVRGERLCHVVAVGGLRLTRQYPAAAIRAFHCAGQRVDGPVAFHCGDDTVPVALLPARADNEWLMLRLNRLLSSASRKASHSPVGLAG